jgi:CRP/FNR family transcriptional regulator, cyclic AMP receptor protein
MSLSHALQLRGNSIGDVWLGSDRSTALAKKQAANLTTEILPIFYPKGGVFFLEGQPATGIFLLRAGRAKESMGSNKGKTAISRVLGPGSILGLMAVLTGAPQECTVETLEPTHADYLRKAAFLDLLKNSRHLSQIVTKQLVYTCKETYAGIRCLGVSASASERLVRLLLHWAELPLANQVEHEWGVRIRVTLTHEEIGQFVGTTRETATRILGDLRKKKWLSMKGSSWTLTNLEALRRLAGV